MARASGASLGSTVMNAVHLGPDLDLLGVEEGADHGRRRVRAAAAESGRDPVLVAPM